MPTQTRLVTIHIQGGCLVSVEGLPPGLDYVLYDHDNCEVDDTARAACVWCQQQEAGR